jgi:hypothetical protein
LAPKSCECNHIPLIVASDQPSRIVRFAFEEVAEWYAVIIALQHTLIAGGEFVAPVPHLRWLDPPLVPDLALTVRSTIVLRC